MKVSLQEYQGLHLLLVEGPIDTHNFKVLKVGITKLFRSGKNRMILELKDASNMEDALIREMGTLNLLARELSGEIAMLIADSALRTKIASFAKPNVVSVFPDRDSAAKSLKGEAKAPTVPPPAVDPLASLESKAAVDKKDEEIKALKQQLKQKEAGELNELKKHNAHLQSECKRLEEELLQMLIQRRAPADEQGYMERIKQLEGQLLSLLKRVEESAGAKK